MHLQKTKCTNCGALSGFSKNYLLLCNVAKEANLFGLTIPAGSSKVFLVQCTICEVWGKYDPQHYLDLVERAEECAESVWWEIQKKYAPTFYIQNYPYRKLRGRKYFLYEAP